MFVYQCAGPVVGEEPSDALRTLVFMANLAAQETTGSADASRGITELIDALATPSPTAHTHIFAVTTDPWAGALGDSQFGYPQFSATGDEAEPPAVGWLIVTQPLADNIHSLDISLVLDADFQPIPGTPPSDAARELVVDMLGISDDIARRFGRSVIHLWDQHALGAASPFAATFRDAGYTCALAQTEYVIPARLADLLARPDIEVFANTDFPEDLLPGVAELYTAASLDQPLGALDIRRAGWDTARLAESTAHFRALGTENYHAIATTDTGDVVGISEIWIHEGFSPKVAIQGLTYVRSEHRHRGLGTALKSHAHNAALTAHPELARIYTSVADDNTAMIALNKELGATAISHVTAWQKQV